MAEQNVPESPTVNWRVRIDFLPFDPSIDELWKQHAKQRSAARRRPSGSTPSPPTIPPILRIPRPAPLVDAPRAHPRPAPARRRGDDRDHRIGDPSVAEESFLRHRVTARGDLCQRRASCADAALRASSSPRLPTTPGAMERRSRPFTGRPGQVPRTLISSTSINGGQVDQSVIDFLDEQAQVAELWLMTQDFHCLPRTILDDRFGG